MEESVGVVRGKNLLKEDFDKICRCCLSVRIPLDSIFCIFEVLYEGRLLVDILHSLFGTQVNPEENLPKNLCETCADEIVRSYVFQKRYKASEAVLRNIATKTENVNSEMKPLKDSYCEVVEEELVIDKIEIENVNLETSHFEDRFEEVESKIEFENMNLEIKLDPFEDSVQIENVIAGCKENETEVKVEQKQSSLFTCYCEKVFTSKIEFIEHQELENHYVPVCFPCKYCGKLIPKHFLQKHLKIHESCKGKYVCEFCEKSFIKVTAFKQHRSIHKREKLYHCDVCGNQFAQNMQLILHKFTHDKQRSGQKLKGKVICVQCGKVCSNQMLYRVHLYKHGLGEGQCKIYK